ncbi:hypothetical protein HNP84_005951 [Thermocatellispora tengchongensis]|uniref:Cas10/Cmr2 second palm domain-containing protein n=1 Tax=Thermocatellispora tengchongensis TaxID=1073253 RepID=A0A840PGE2_9ACTN|nr:hypothetical protein [Thermocatellispora tengchongensis]MBB5136207.1 hypothetical protein [Thermocatellispora tengchongensis]
MYVVVIRTAGNQRYIFASNKRQEIVGASELIVKVEGAWAKEALEETFGGETHRFERLVAGAGQIVLLVKEVADGRRMVTEVTRRALRYAPGLDVCGIVVRYDEGGLAEAVQEAQSRLASVREARPGPQARFLRLPIVEDCASTGLPAAEIRREGGPPPKGKPEERPQPRSAVSLAKLAAHEDALLRMGDLAGKEREEMRRTVQWLGFEAGWVAVVHADGNGIGAIFTGLREWARGRDDSAYAEALRDVSAGLNECAQRAFRKANDSNARILPLVVGGDDLTVVCEAEAALPFTRRYLEAFEEETAQDERITAYVPGGIGAAAGVAIVKRNYPFHFAYDLAEELIEQEAKQVKGWASALAFAVLHESAAPDLKRIRGAVPIVEDLSGSASPYIVGRGAADPRAEHRRWSDLERRVNALTRDEPGTGGPLIPRGAAHDLREGVCLGEKVVASRVTALRHRFEGDQARTQALAELTEDDGGLVWAEDGTKVTGLLDAMAALPFLAGEGAAR